MGRPAAAFVINPTRLRDPRGFERRAQAAAREHGWDAWFAETTGADGGHAPTRRALAAGAGLVFAAGGDGTVRACAGALAGTGVPLAIVPLGTANLTARALRVPARAGRAIDAAFGGRNRRIDLGRVDEAGAGAGGTGTDGLVFAAMAGIGLDAAVVGAARPDTKRWLGWVAYAASGVMRLRRPACDFTVRVDDREPVRRRAQCVVVGNAGLLPGGFILLPEARLDDGRLDVGILAPSGVWGWLRAGGRVLTRVRGQDRTLERWPARQVEISADTDQPRQVDGEIVTPGRVLRASVCPGALVVRLAAD